MTDTGDQFRGTDRFQILRRLGSGGMGVVYAARDHHRDEVVALKTLRWTDANAIYRLKKEFRILADIAHPNLVTLYELVGEGDHWFFTMELVEGSEFLAFVRPAALDAGRLRMSLIQLAQGLAAIHRAGKLHRDLKPSNVRVTPEGRVVILDFGISADVVLGDSPVRTVEEGIWGTPEYMSPEQAEKQAIPSSDWYSVGCMLYEALTGNPPFIGRPLKVLTDKREREPSRPELPGSEMPADLADLCMQLLERDPDRRPSGSDVLRRLGATQRPTPARGLAQPLVDAPLIGRERQMAELDQAFAAAQAGQAVTVYVHGPSGIGKSVLVERFLQRLAGETDPPPIVLRGRCYVRESMPYKGVDGIVDSLTQFLRTLPDTDVARTLPDDALFLAELFPVLGRVEKLSQLQWPTEKVQDPVQMRRRAFAALRELFRRVSTLRPVLLHIDDLQWSDADSILLLEYLLAPPSPPPILLVACFRSEEISSNPFLATLLDARHAKRPRQVRVDALSPAETARLARQLLDSETGNQHVDAIVRESAGNPFLVEELVRYAVIARHEQRADPSGISLGEMLEERVARLPAGSRPFLEALAIAAGPTAAVVIRDVAGMIGDERPLVAALQAEHLLRSSTSVELVEFYHDRIRETLAARIDPTSIVDIHLRLIRALEAHRADDPETLYEHYLAAGQRQRAAACALQAGDKAARALAFERAAAFYGRALELTRDTGRVTGELRVKMGEALANAGRGPEAAEAFLGAAAQVRDLDAGELRRRAAEQLLRSGHVDRGLTVVQAVLDAVGLRLARSPKQALLRLMARRALLRIRGLRFTERRAEQIDPGLLSRIDACWAVAIGLARVDNIRAADFQTLHLLLALRAGEPFRVARALAAEAGFVSTGGGSSRVRAMNLVAAARNVAERIDQADALAYASFAAGITSFYMGEFTAARDACERAERMFRERSIGLVWEVNTAQTFASSSLYYLGDLAELARRVPVRLREARERGDLYAAADVAAGRPIVAWLMEEDVTGARQAIDEAMASWSATGFHLQRYFGLFAEVQVDLYAGHGLDAWRRTTERWGALARSMVLRVQLIRLEAFHLRARCALAAAATARDAAPLLVSAERDARRIARERRPWSDPLARLVLAAVQAARAPTSAVDLLTQAVAGFEAAHMTAFATAARRRQGELIGGTAGADLVTQADAWMRSQGVRQPESFTRMLAPGFPPPARAR
jgi:tetratricopeptide (TPR) repeat protein